MGQANRRGTFEERKAKAVIRNKASVRAAVEGLEKQRAIKEAGLTPEEKSDQLRNKIALMSFMSFGQMLGFSPKELKRKMIRHNKKRVKK